MEDGAAEQGSKHCSRVVGAPSIDIAAIDNDNLRDARRGVLAKAADGARKEEAVAIKMMEIADMELVANQSEAAHPLRLRRRRVVKSRGRQAIIVPA